MKRDSIEFVLLLEAILFWSITLPTAAVFLTFATLWNKIELSAPRRQLARWATPRIYL